MHAPIGDQFACVTKPKWNHGILAFATLPPGNRHRQRDEKIARRGLATVLQWLSHAGGRGLAISHPLQAMKNLQLFLIVLPLLGAPSAAAAEISYNDDVRPILSNKCFKCHGFDPATRKSGLRLDTFEGATQGPGGVGAIIPGKPDDSEVMARILTTDPDDHMPPKGESLSDAEVATLKQWIAQGAKYGVHWAYSPVKRPRPPQVARSGWVRNPIDHFILHRIEKAALSPASVAEPAVLLRRVHFDLTGLPPSAEDVKAFEADPSPANYERIVRRLLQSPAFGEHWARWWLDLARYADSTGYTHDMPRVTWPFRDWVINALNRGMPFDQFTIEQVAGDLLPKPTREQVLATGFFRVGAVNLDGGGKVDEIQWMMAKDRVNTTGAVWLASTLECSQCHTHKFDPFTTKEYYEMAAYFRSNEEEVIPLEHRGGAKRLYGATLSLDSYPKDEMSDEALRAKAEDTSARLLATKAISDQIVQGRRPVQPGEPDYVQLAKDINAKEAAPLVDHYDKYAPYRVWVMRERQMPRACHVLKRGDYQSPGEEVRPGTPAALHPLRRLKVANRMELARWLISSDNPLTARVIMNRFWNELFGRGIVTTTEDFGRQGALPSHPELLDWLASEFMAGGWNLKKALFTIMTSATYRQSSDRGNGQIPEELFAYGPRHRLSAESIRDSALAIAGLLKQKIGGEPVYPPQPDGLWNEIFQVVAPHYPTSTGADVYRRSVYVFWRRGSLFPVFTNFDATDRNMSVTKRLRSNTPLQALTLMNEPVFVEASRAFGERIRSQKGTQRDKLAWAFRTALARAPADDELAVLASLLTTHNGAGAEREGWFNVAHTLLNLDETIVKR